MATRKKKKTKGGPAKGSGKTHVFVTPRNIKRMVYALLAASGLSFILDFFIPRYVNHPWESLFGFYAVYSFAACIFLVLVAKQMRKLLMRKEDYYDE